MATSLIDTLVGKLRNSAAPLITNPTIVDAGTKLLVGISRDRITTYWADTTSATSGQFYTSTDDGVTFSAGWMTTPFAAQIIAIAETPMGEILISTYGNGSRGSLIRTVGWPQRVSPPGNWGTVVLSCSDFGNHIRPWNLNDQIGHGDTLYLSEYGKNSGTSTLQARLGWLSKDDGQTWISVFDLFSATAGLAGAGFDSATVGYHTHCGIFDPWTGRVWQTTGDADDAIWYSDDIARMQIVGDAATTSSSTTLTVAATGVNTFNAQDIGANVIGAGIPYGATITAVTNKYTVVLSAAATATATGVKIAWGTCSWKRAHKGRGGLYQGTTLLATPNNIFVGSDGYPGGIQRIRKSAAGINPAVGNAYHTLNSAPTSTSTVGNYAYRAGNLERPPVLMACNVSSAGTSTEPGKLIATVDEERWYIIWQDTAYPGPGSGFSIAVHTALGNVLGMITSTRTVSGRQIFRAPMPVFPNAPGPWN